MMPGSKVVVVIENSTVRLNSRVALFARESETRTVNELVPVTVGTPLIRPLEDRLNPDGRVPDAMDHVYPEPLPPVALSVWE